MRYLLAVGLLLATITPVAAQHDLAARQQWQPWITEGGLDPDRQLEQPVEIEIMGRAAIPGLAPLAEKIGVALGVAPEDVNSLGERKFSVFAHGCTLKQVMVQLTRALQECHWDIDRSGPEPSYWLHRNSGVEETMAWLAEREQARRAGERRGVRTNRLEEGRKALAMPPAELADLEKSDPMLARSVRDAYSRDLLETVLSLPEDQMQQFQDTGRVTWDYVQAPRRLQQAMNRIAEWFLVRYGGENQPEEVLKWRDHLGHAAITLEDYGTDHGWGVWLALDFPGDVRQGNTRIHDVAVQPRYPNLDEGQPPFTRLLVATGGAPDEEAAMRMAIGMDQQGFRVEAAKREERQKQEWREPDDPDLLQIISLGDEQFASFAELQRSISEKTGLSVISDYFTTRPPYLSEEVRKGVPLWRLLYLIGESESLGDLYLWTKAGRCLAFCRADWYQLVKQEIPEGLLTAYQEKLKAQGRLTLDDVAAFALALGDRAIDYGAIPVELSRTGLASVGYARWALALYASLSPDQVAKARSPEGLPYAEMNLVQQQQVAEAAAKLNRSLPREEVPRSALCITESSREVRGRRYDTTGFQIKVPSGTCETAVTLFVPPPPAAQETGAKQ